MSVYTSSEAAAIVPLPPRLECPAPLRPSLSGLSSLAAAAGTASRKRPRPRSVSVHETASRRGDDHTHEHDDDAIAATDDATGCHGRCARRVVAGAHTYNTVTLAGTRLHVGSGAPPFAACTLCAAQSAAPGHALAPTYHITVAEGAQLSLALGAAPHRVHVRGNVAQLTARGAHVSVHGSVTLHCQAPGGAMLGQPNTAAAAAAVEAGPTPMGQS